MLTHIFPMRWPRRPAMAAMATLALAAGTVAGGLGGPTPRVGRAPQARKDRT